MSGDSVIVGFCGASKFMSVKVGAASNSGSGISMSKSDGIGNRSGAMSVTSVAFVVSASESVVVVSESVAVVFDGVGVGML